MSASTFAPAALVLWFSLVPGPAFAADVSPPATGLESTETCRAGRAVVDRQQRSGEILGQSNGMCVVRLADGSSYSYLHWMLEDADAARYVDRAGNEGEYRLDADSGLIAFASGSLAGYHAKLLGPGKFGLAAEPTTMFYTVCNVTAG